MEEPHLPSGVLRPPSQAGMRGGASPTPASHGATPSMASQPPLLSIDITGLQTLIYTLQAEHVEMKGLVNKFSYGLGQLDEMNTHMDRLAAEVVSLRKTGGGGGGGLPKEFAEQWEGMLQTVNANSAAVKESFKFRADMQMQYATLQAQVQALREGEGWRETMDRLSASAEDHEKRLAAVESAVAELTTGAAKMAKGHGELEASYLRHKGRTADAVTNLQKSVAGSQKEHSAELAKLNRVTAEMKEQLYHHSEEMKSVHDAASAAMLSQSSLVDAMRADVKSMQLRLETSSSEERNLADAMRLYDRVVEEEREEDNLWSKIKRRAEAVSRVCMATGAAMAAAGKAASSVSDKVVNQLASAVDKLRADVEDMDEVIDMHDKQATAHGNRLAALEEEAKKQQVSGDQVVSFAALEEALARSEAVAHQTLHQSTRRLDELAGQAELLAETKMDRAESISRQYLEKSVGEISMEFAAALQRHRQEINRYLNDKAQADVLMDMEGRFGARLQQMEAILMKGVKGLDERATAALARKADAGALQRLADRVELLLVNQGELRRATSPQAAITRGGQCLSCAGPVGDRDPYAAAGGGSGAPATTNAMYNRFGGMVTGDLKGASFNARLHTPQGGRRPTPKATPAARFRDADDARELLDSAGEDLGANYGRPASMQGPRGSYSRGSHGVPRSTSAQDPFPPPAGLDEFHMLPAVSNR